MNKSSYLNRYISMLYRMNNPYFDKKMSKFHLGCGQQGFLMHLMKHPGASFQELAAVGNYDKATATRAVRKMEEEGYVRLEMDSKDKRIRHIYLTEAAQPVLHAAAECAAEWVKIITAGFRETEKETAEALLKRMAENAHEYTKQFRHEETEPETGTTTEEKN